MIKNFRDATSSVAGGVANEGQGKFGLVPDRAASFPQMRAAHPAPRSTADAALLEHVITYIQSAQPLFSRSLIESYYRALASFPLVVLTGSDLRAAAELSRLFAEAVVGGGSGQALLASGAAWHQATGEDEYFHAVQERFCRMRCQGLMQDAADPQNSGKAYFLSFESISAQALLAQARGFWPGDGLESLAISATMDMRELPMVLATLGAEHVGIVDVHAPMVVSESRHQALPPVGYQRQWLRTRAAALRHGNSPCDDRQLPPSMCPSVLRVRESLARRAA